MRRTILAGLLVALTLAGPVYATQTTTFSGHGSRNAAFTVHFQTYRVGDLAVRFQWVPKTKADYIVDARHLSYVGAPIWDYDLSCHYWVPIVHPEWNGDLTCSFPAAPIGEWAAIWSPSGGQDVTVTIVGETDQ